MTEVFNFYDNGLNVVSIKLSECDEEKIKLIEAVKSLNLEREKMMLENHMLELKITDLKHSISSENFKKWWFSK